MRVFGFLRGTKDAKDGNRSVSNACLNLLFMVKAELPALESMTGSNI